MGAKEAVDWVALNPGFKDATFVNDAETCRTCHEDSMKVYAGTMHALAAHAGSQGAAVSCDSCDGPRSKHVENPTADLKFDRSSRAPSCRSFVIDPAISLA
jgi:hypothetical protein